MLKVKELFEGFIPQVEGLWRDKGTITKKLIRTWRNWLPQLLSRLSISLYFINHGWTHLIDHWWNYQAISFPFLGMPMIVIGFFVSINFKVHIFALCLVLLQAVEVCEITGQRLFYWIFVGQPFYLNELMVKKIAMLGCTVILLMNQPSFKNSIDRARTALSSGGLIGEEDNDSDSIAVKKLLGNDSLLTANQPIKMNKKTSALLLAVRLFIALLFVFVGLTEIFRQLQGGIVRNGQIHKRPPGDGHDQLLLKIIQFGFSVPFVVGYKTKLCSLSLAFSMFAEALIYWRWKESVLGVAYILHARDHFFTNVGVGGGLLLLCSFGGGKYSVDEMIAKKKS